MKQIISYSTVLFISAILITACNRRDCINSDPVFDTAVPGTEEYNKQLVNKISSHKDLNYYVNGYKEENGKTYLQVQVQNDSVCALMMLQVDNWAGIETIKEKAAMSYHGAKLSGLKFHIGKDSLGTHFVYESVEKVVD